MKLFRVIVARDEPTVKEGHKSVTPIQHIETIYAANDISIVWEKAYSELVEGFGDEIIEIKEVAPAVFILAGEQHE